MMKKLLALVMSAALPFALSVSAFAAVDIGVDGADAASPGEILRVYGDSFGSNRVALVDDWHFSAEYFTISGRTFEKGASLVKEVLFNGEENSLDIVLHDNYELFAPNGCNLVIKELAVKGRVNLDRDGDSLYDTAAGEIKKGTEYLYGGTPTAEIFGAAKEFKIGYIRSDLVLDGPVTYPEGEMVRFVTGEYSSEIATMDSVDVSLESRVYAGDQVYAAVNNDMDRDVLAAVTQGADIRFYNVVTSGFSAANTLRLSVPEELYVYSVVEGQLAPSNLVWSSEDAAFVGTIRSSASYAVSDVKLEAPATLKGDAALGLPGENESEIEITYTIKISGVYRATDVDYEKLLEILTEALQEEVK